LQSIGIGRPAAVAMIAGNRFLKRNAHGLNPSIPVSALATLAALVSKFHLGTQVRAKLCFACRCLMPRLRREAQLRDQVRSQTQFGNENDGYFFVYL
jgi:hypothetical protein